MPAAKRELVIAAALAKLQAISGIAGLVVERNRRDAVEDFPSLVWRDGGHSVNAEAIAYDLTTIEVDVEIRVRAAPGSDHGTLINEIYAAAKAALLADQSLAGTAHEVRETGMSQPDVDVGDSAEVYAVAVVGFEIDFWSTRNSPY
jgi:hypothetical protein